jgi:hypothetical protein
VLPVRPAAPVPSKTRTHGVRTRSRKAVVVVIAGLSNVRDTKKRASWTLKVRCSRSEREADELLEF